MLRAEGCRGASWFSGRCLYSRVPPAAVSVRTCCRCCSGDEFWKKSSLYSSLFSARRVEGRWRAVRLRVLVMQKGLTGVCDARHLLGWMGGIDIRPEEYPFDNLNAPSCPASLLGAYYSPVRLTSPDSPGDASDLKTDRRFTSVKLPSKSSQRHGTESLS